MHAQPTSFPGLPLTEALTVAERAYLDPVTKVRLHIVAS